jgi:hypothetical protein
LQTQSNPRGLSHARSAIIDRADMNAEQARVYDAAKQSSGIVGGPYHAYIRLPKLFEACQNLRAALAVEIKGHANGSLCVTRLTTFLKPGHGRHVSLGRGACLALGSRLLQLGPRCPRASPYDRTRPRKNR